MSVAPIAMHSASSAIPALPGAQNRRSTRGDAEIPQASACPRPPQPTTSTRIALPPALGYHVGMDDTSIAAPVRSNLAEYTVSELSRALKRSIEENISFVRVRGEISGWKRHSSGHCYLCLKNSAAALDAVCWRTTAIRLGIKPEDGMEVVCTGRLTTFPGRSKYQLIINTIELAGIGALLKLLEDRRRRLAAEGLFAPERKKKLPFLPEVIGIVTSPSGAVIRDVLHRLSDRFPRRVLLWPVAVQGEGAAAQVAAAITGFNRLPDGSAVPRPQLIIVARGCGWPPTGACGRPSTASTSRQRGCGPPCCRPISTAHAPAPRNSSRGCAPRWRALLTEASMRSTILPDGSRPIRNATKACSRAAM